ncbi:hypothetical protein BFN67_01655 [Pseudaminobacter manganicus]|uniref:Uncharacterized protein n=1 Tax=Manganibacter manganicus TaxID=1873176 RepID=A0A1V8RWL8_9HYPH|nr:hypothetical protein BFN67_01655 [Pseudaminobacter manganicus]
MCSGDLVAELERIALAVQFLFPSHTDPERFHVDKSEIVRSLRDLAAQSDGGGHRWWSSDRPGVSESVGMR